MEIHRAILSRARLGPTLVVTALLGSLAACSASHRAAPRVSERPSASVLASTVPAGASPAQPSSPTADQPAVVPSAELAVDPLATDTARFLAGMEGGSGARLDGLRAAPSWQEHALHLSSQWASFDQRRLGRVRRFSQTELTDGERRSPWVFYPFSGPDLVFADALFPHSAELVLAGLEPVGELPEVERLGAARLMTTLGHLRGSLVPALGLGYFISERMETEQVEARFPGVLPMLYVFLARTGHEIVSVEQVEVTPDGSVRTRSGPDPGPIPGVAIRCRRPGETSRLVTYFRVDLRDAALGSDDRFVALVGRRGPAVTLLKCASYLLHEGRFARLRQLILERSAAVIQDPSGLPFAAFPPGRWSVSLYGSFVQPVSRFAHRPQPDLRRAFGTSAAGPLDFATGYQSSRAGSSLLVARRAAAPAPPP